jgi:hypothetical protein
MQLRSMVLFHQLRRRRRRAAAATKEANKKEEKGVAVTVPALRRG